MYNQNSDVPDSESLGAMKLCLTGMTVDCWYNIGHNQLGRWHLVEESYQSGVKFFMQSLNLEAPEHRRLCASHKYSF